MWTAFYTAKPDKNVNVLKFPHFIHNRLSQRTQIEKKMNSVEIDVNTTVVYVYVLTNRSRSLSLYVYVSMRACMMMTHSRKLTKIFDFTLSNASISYSFSSH